MCTRSGLKPHTPINELVIVTALSRQPLTQTGKKASPLEMDAMQSKRTVFSTCSCLGGQQLPTQSQGVSNLSPCRDGHAVCTLSMGVSKAEPRDGYAVYKGHGTK